MGRTPPPATETVRNADIALLQNNLIMISDKNKSKNHRFEAFPIVLQQESGAQLEFRNLQARFSQNLLRGFFPNFARVLISC